MNRFQAKPKIEELVFQLFNDPKYENLKFEPSANNPAHRADLSFEEHKGLTVVEIRQYSPYSPPNLEILEKALQQTEFIRSEFDANKSILVVTCNLNPAGKKLASNYKKIEVWELKDILEKAEKESADLRKKFSRVLELSNTTNLLDFLTEEVVETPSPAIEDHVIPEEKGKQLASNLKKILPGRSQFTSFEDACIESLKYLFDGDLVGWHAQQASSDKLTRKDLVCRIESKNNFWNLISTSLNSRYIIFEFKNYTDKFEQKEVITTERYLYPTALRTTAIIISPKGGDESAEKVIAGAMREHGKLIISITVDEICDLLMGKDKGEDPNTFLYDKVDEFLMSLSR